MNEWQRLEILKLLDEIEAANLEVQNSLAKIAGTLEELAEVSR